MRRFSGENLKINSYDFFLNKCCFLTHILKLLYISVSNPEVVGSNPGSVNFFFIFFYFFFYFYFLNT